MKQRLIEVRTLNKVERRKKPSCSHFDPSLKEIVLDTRQQPLQVLCDALHEAYHVIEYYARRRVKRFANEKQCKKGIYSEAEEFAQDVLKIARK